jgi:hypothetical protein
MTDWIHSATGDAAAISAVSRQQWQPFVPLLVGALLGLFGLCFIAFGLDYRLGTLRSMGPGMFPVAGGSVLVILALALAWTGRRSAERLDFVALRPLIAILASVVIFALLIERAGLSIAAPILVTGAVLATGQGSLRLALAIAIPLTTAAIIVFPYLLGVPLPVFP